MLNDRWGALEGGGGGGGGCREAAGDGHVALQGRKLGMCVMTVAVIAVVVIAVVVVVGRDCLLIFPLSL